MPRRKQSSATESDPKAAASAAVVPTRAIDKLSLRQRRYLQYLTDPESPSYDNQTESYRRAYGPVASAAVRASNLANTGNTALALREELEKQGLTKVVRVDRLKDVILGKVSTRSVQTTVRDPETGVVTTTTETGVRPQDTLRALALADKWDGSESARRAEAEAHGTVLKGLAARLLRDMSPPTDASSRRTRKVRQGEATDATMVESADTASPDAATGTGSGT